MKKFNKGDWVRFINPFLPRPFNRGRKGIVVEASHPDMVRVLYTGRSSPKWVDVAHLEKIEDNNDET